MLKRSLYAMTLILVVFALAAPAAVLAQTPQPTTVAPSTVNQPPKLTFYTAFPSQVSGLGETVSITLLLKMTGTDQVVALAMKDLPAGWTATFRGDNRIIQAAYLLVDKEAAVELRLEPSKDVKPGNYKFTVTATGKDVNSTLAIDLTVKEKLPPKLALETSLPILKGTPSTTFTFDLTLRNDGDEDLTVTLTADSKNVFQVKFTLIGQEVTSFPLAAKDSKSISMAASPLNTLQAGSYPISVKAQGGTAQTTLALTADVSGQVSLSLSTPSGQLSGDVYSGQSTPVKLTLKNTGSAPARKIDMGADTAAGWSVTFEPASIAELAAGQSADVTATIKPSDKAVAGDYMITLRATPSEGSAKSVDFRVTVLTSTLWGIVGIVLIAVAVGVVAIAVMRFGRR